MLTFDININVGCMIWICLYKDSAMYTLCCLATELWIIGGLRHALVWWLWTIMVPPKHVDILAFIQAADNGAFGTESANA